MGPIWPRSTLICPRNLPIRIRRFSPTIGSCLFFDLRSPGSDAFGRTEPSRRCRQRKSRCARPQRWDNPFCDVMTEKVVDELLALSPFCDMDEARFSRSCSLRGILKNDARLIELTQGDIVVREGDYGNSAFVILQGTAARGARIAAANNSWVVPQRSRKNILQMAVQQLFGTAPPRAARIWPSATRSSARVARRRSGNAGLPCKMFRVCSANSIP